MLVESINTAMLPRGLGHNRPEQAAQNLLQLVGPPIFAVLELYHSTLDMKFELLLLCSIIISLVRTTYEATDTDRSCDIWM
jgi:hypothetical protein